MRIPHGERVGLDDGALIRVGGTLLVLREDLEGVTPGRWPAELATTYGLEGVVREIDWLAARPQPAVLVTGETGTGKEALSRMVAERLRPGKKVVTVNVAGIAETVFEAQLFGHERGAYTGAVAAARGILETHNGGSVILDELGELPLALQPKLLRAIENQVVQPVGAAEPRKIDVLIIGATQRDLDADVAAGRFRADLLARFPARIELPPLRERREDVFAVMQALATKRGERYDPEQVHAEALERLILEPWPTNVRGLYAALESIARGAPPPALHLADVERVIGPAKTRPPLTREAVQRAIEACGGNKARSRTPARREPRRVVPDSRREVISADSGS